jgi:hypothetical protein
MLSEGSGALIKNRCGKVERRSDEDIGSVFVLYVSLALKNLPL